MHRTEVMAIQPAKLKAICKVSYTTIPCSIRPLSSSRDMHKSYHILYGFSIENCLYLVYKKLISTE